MWPACRAQRARIYISKCRRFIKEGSKMDVARLSFGFIIAALHGGTALAAGPGDWSSAGPTSIPTITASPNDRYSYPQSAQPITTRAQNAVNETATSLRDGFNAGVSATGQQVQSWTNAGSQQLQSAGNNLRSGAQQTLGTVGYPSQSSNPFATQPQAPAASSASRGGVAPPPWGANSTAPAAPVTSVAPAWADSSLPVTPVDHSMLATPSSPQPSSNWSSIGSAIAAPPLLTPTMPPSTNPFAPLNTMPADSGPSFTTDAFRGNQPNTGSSVNSAPQSSSASNTDDWAAKWDASANNSGSNSSNNSSFGRGPSAFSRDNSNSARSSEFGAGPRLSANTPEVKSTVAKPADGWLNDAWTQNSQSPQNGTSTAIGSARNATISAANNNAQQPQIQSPTNAPQLNGQPIGTAGNNTNFGGQNSGFSQQPQTMNTGKAVQAGVAGEPQPWVTLLVAILGLAGSLAANIYLGWSYLDARQKYQALVRRTAETFRRTHTVAA
jgi:hypothetical protein